MCVCVGREGDYGMLFNFDAFTWFFPFTGMLFCTAATREHG